MSPLRFLRAVIVRRRLGPATLKLFDQALSAAGVLTGRSEVGVVSVPIREIVGSVGRAQSLRPDFLPRTPPTITDRHRRIAEAMAVGRPLPPLELYRITIRRIDRSDAPPVQEYYVVDGHHRVATARRFGQVYLDARVIEYRVLAPAPDPVPTAA